MVWEPITILFTELYCMDLGLGVKLSLVFIRASRKSWCSSMWRFKQGVMMLNMDWLMTELAMCCSGKDSRTAWKARPFPWTIFWVPFFTCWSEDSCNLFLAAGFSWFGFWSEWRRHYHSRYSAVLYKFQLFEHWSVLLFVCLFVCVILSSRGRRDSTPPLYWFRKML